MRSDGFEGLAEYHRVAELQPTNCGVLHLLGNQ